MTEALQIAMLPKRVEGCDWTYYVDPGKRTGEMPCKRDLEAHTTTTFWIPDGEVPDRPLIAVYVVTVGHRPGVRLGFGVTLQDADLEPVELQLYEYPSGATPEWWTGITLTDEQRAYLNGEGFFALEVAMAPPPPVAVWIGGGTT